MSPKELAEGLQELIKLATKDTNLSKDFVKGYVHVAKMVIDWCHRTSDVPDVPDIQKNILSLQSKPTSNRLDN